MRLRHWMTAVGLCAVVAFSTTSGFSSSPVLPIFAWGLQWVSTVSAGPPGQLIKDLYTFLKRTLGDSDSEPSSVSPLPSSKYTAWKDRQTTCLTRFICEIHAESRTDDAGQIEKKIIKLFQRLDVERPDSPVYRFQFAAHMGQLFRDVEGEGCHALYPTCPFRKDDMLFIMLNLHDPAKKDTIKE